MPTCLACDKEFASRQSLYNHRKRMHSDSMEKKDLAKSIIDGLEKPKRKFQDEKKNSILPWSDIR